MESDNNIYTGQDLPFVRIYLVFMVTCSVYRHGKERTGLRDWIAEGLQATNLENYVSGWRGWEIWIQGNEKKNGPEDDS